MKTFTSASAAKYLKALQDEKDHVLSRERTACTYTLAAGEEAEPPEYDYEGTRREVARIDAQMRTLRHALHLFNATEVLPESGVTVDEALILLAQLNNEKGRLATMRSRQKRERAGHGMYFRSEAVEYTYANYDVAKAGEDYLAVSDRISALQLEIDLCNQTRTFEADL